MKEFAKSEKFRNGLIKSAQSRKGKKNSKEANINISNGIKEKRQKVICCLKCHKQNNKIFEGLWMCHYETHHKNC
jgi:hypothetical protein